MKLLNSMITGVYSGDAWVLTIKIDTQHPEIIAEIEIGDGYMDDTVVSDSIELGIWLWYLGIVGKDVDGIIAQVDGAQTFCLACS